MPARNSSISNGLLMLAPNVSRYHVDTAVSKLMADLHSGLLIEVMVELVAIAAADWRKVMRDLLIAFARIGRS